MRDPFVGPEPFRREDAWRFFGRGDVTDELFSLLLASRTLLLYSQSGAGKTSLINAGLLPLAEDEGFDILPPARLQGVFPAGASTEGIGSPYTFFTLASWDWMGCTGTSRPCTVAEALRLRPKPLDRFGDPAPRLVVLDQFEELFTAFPQYWQHRSRYLEDLAAALEQDPGLHVLICLREEYLADILNLAYVLPDRGRTQFRLSRLRHDNAVEAVELPIQATGRTFADGVVARLVEDLMRIRVETMPGEAMEVLGEFVEPVQLQVVCSSLWRSLPADTTQITDAHVRSFGDVTTALARFYDNAVATTSRTTGLPEAALRHWFESQLITPANTRSMAYRGRLSTAGLDNRCVDILESHHMIRAEFRAGSRWYELTHDRFIGPIQSSNARVRELEATARSTMPRGPRPWAIVAVLTAIGIGIGLEVLRTDPTPLTLFAQLAAVSLGALGVAQFLTVPSDWLFGLTGWPRQLRWISGAAGLLVGLFGLLGALAIVYDEPEYDPTRTFAAYVESLNREIPKPDEPTCGGSALEVHLSGPTPTLSPATGTTPDQLRRLDEYAKLWCKEEASYWVDFSCYLAGIAMAISFLGGREIWMACRRTSAR